jgi:RES domain-containing protein
MNSRRRELSLIDALDGMSGRQIRGRYWRVVRDGRDPLLCSSSGGRWDDATFDVLYTSERKEVAISEIEFHLRRGQPIVPTKLKMRLFEIEVNLDNVLCLETLEDLAELGLDDTRFGQLSYLDRGSEYHRSQQIAEVAHFHGFDGLLVPSARADGLNLVIFCDQTNGASLEIVRDWGFVDWR